MPSRRFQGLAVASLLLATAASAQPATPAFDAAVLARATVLRDTALRDNRAYELVADLTTRIGPRLAGSEGDRQAVIWAQKQLRRAGFANVRAEPVRVPLWQRREIRVSLGEARLAAAALGGSVGGSADAEVRRFASLAELQALPSDALQGRIAFIDQAMERTRDGSGYSSAVGARFHGAVEAARRGASALVIRSIGTSAGGVAHTGTMRADPGVTAIPAVALSNADADRLAAALQAGPARLRVHVGSRRFGDAESANVIGEIPGSSDEIVLLAAHLDSWDLGTGANDDAAGVAIVIEAARLIAHAGIRPRRTLRVVLYANEEFGLSGARQYAEAHAAELDRHVLAMEADFGSGAVFQLASRVAEPALPAIASMQELLRPLGVEPAHNQASGGPDLRPLRERGVPVLEPRQDGTLYFDVHHTERDVLASIDRAGLRQNVAVYAVAAYLASEYGPGFGRLPATAAAP